MSFDVDEMIDEGTNREAVVSCLPRLLRVALSRPDAASPWFDALAIEVAAVRPDLASPYAEAVADARYHHLRELRGVDPARPPSIAVVAAAIDATVATGAASAELASILLLVFGDPADKLVCARLASACRAAMTGVSARSLAAELAARNTLGPVDWRRVAAQARRHAGLLARREAEIEAGKPGIAIDPALARAAQLEAWRQAGQDVMGLCRELVIGLSCMAAGEVAEGYNVALVEHARRIGERSLGEAARLAEERTTARYQRLAEREAEAAKVAEEKAAPARMAAEVPAGHVRVCPILPLVGKTGEVASAYKRAVGVPLPLVPVPDLRAVRSSLTSEFPHCEDLNGQVLRELAASEHVRLRPLLFAGSPGSGKSRYVRRLGELVGVGVFRVDGAGDAGVSFAGTERRWYSTEPCRPFMACARFGQANPFVLVDEIDKAPTRSDYGRLWDGMLSFMEGETASRFQDPCLQVEIDLAHVSILATANDVRPLPPPLLDRFGIVLNMPQPGQEHMEALANSIAREQAVRQGWDARFAEPFDAIELDAMRRFWRGGSIRRLGRLVAAAIRARDASRTGRLN
ncbi:AAA family ATPase [Bosea vestrisii]|uniref:AAA family ATPase n=1 Tax=Bosea vestrisii TaxID=151416 RepID=A0ABW0H8W4_9HYPH